MKNTAADTALEFIDNINSHDVALISGLVTEDHLFIDAQGNELRGKRQLERSWRACFEWFPDYSLQIDQVFANGTIAVITGLARGTYGIHGRLNRESRWKTPSAWQAVTRGRLLAEWRVYADNGPIWAAMRSRQRQNITALYSEAGTV